MTAFSPQDLLQALPRFRETTFVVQAPDGSVGLQFQSPSQDLTLLGVLPPLYPEWLGNRSFTETHGLRFPYVGGAMANGITSPAMVISLARAGMLSFLGTAGLSLPKMREYLVATSQELSAQGLPFGANLIHSPQEPHLEMNTVELFFEHGIRRVSASAFMKLSPAIIRFAARGLRRLEDGTIHREHYVFAKISRPEVAAHFLRPPPEKALRALVEAGHLTAQEAELAATLPVAEDLIVESDSGGHTDNRPLSALFPTIAKLRDDIVTHYGYPQVPRLGAAGGIGTPEALAAAFALGADFVLTGSINQASVEAAQSDSAKDLLASAGLADVIMAPAGDMFEMGVEVQVLRRGTLFASRARRLHQVYSRYESIEAIPTEERARLEKEIFQADMNQIWSDTRQFFEHTDPREVTRAESNPHHKLALVCRWYLGLSSKWSIQGTPERAMDYQIWMGPAQGAFNQWVQGSFLEDRRNRTVVQMALNLLEGGAQITRAQQLRTFGTPVPPEAFHFVPRRLQ